MKIDRGKWREAYNSALVAEEVGGTAPLSVYGKRWLGTDGAADKMAGLLGVELVDPEPPEVFLVRASVNSTRANTLRGAMYSGTPVSFAGGMISVLTEFQEWDGESRLISEFRCIGGDAGQEDGIPADVRERHLRGIKSYREFVRELEDDGVIPRGSLPL